ncbi:MAG: HU family DNA-binding protein [Prevotella sp.]|nr:HU family DNA-binding protein [Prevotella sp.]
MNKTELIEKIAASAKLTKADSKKALDATIAAISAALKKGDKVQLVGFGTFSVTKKPAREGINPATKQKIKIAAKKVAKFKAGAELAKVVNK